MPNFLTKTVIAALAGFVILDTGCSRASLSPNTAAQLAAKLANEQCDHLYQQRPFSASQHLALLADGTYKWGGFDPAGPEGYSALVSFRADGRVPHVEIFYSCDPPPFLRSPLEGLNLHPFRLDVPAAVLSQTKP